MTHHTTLNAIRAHHPCEHGWNTLLAGLGKTEPDDEPLAFIRILEINGIADAIWALRCHPDQMTVRSYACDCAERVLPIYELRYPDDSRVRDCISVVRRYIAGDASDDEMRAARADAAAYAARVAAADAADAADAAAYAARVAAADAADAADAAAYAAAYAAERKWQTQRYIEVFGGAQ